MAYDSNNLKPLEPEIKSPIKMLKHQTTASLIKAAMSTLAALLKRITYTKQNV
jgi:hypothetical protein